jgi:hypothetical protein
MVVGEMVPHEPKRLLVQTAAELRRGARQQDTCAEISEHGFLSPSFEAKSGNAASSMPFTCVT